MANGNIQESLNRLLDNLKSGDPVRQLETIRELSTVNFSSEAVVFQLERLVLGENAEVRAAALRALDLATSQYVASKRSTLARSVRQEILKEIDAWQKDELIEPHRAETLRRRYDFDMKPGVSRAPQIASLEATTPPPAAASLPQPPAPPQPAAPRPTLMQSLLSETSIKIYLYLGALFVIVAAAILAALVEEARLSVLLAATFAFAGGAVGLKKRLPQPSFALAIVFSFLLPIDANVIADSLSLSARGNEVYWTVVFLLMAFIWGLGTWFYTSRLFSVVAFLSLSLAALRFGEIFEASTDWNILSVSVAAMLGLLGARRLQNWKDRKFASPLFLLAQAVQGILLFISVVSVLGNGITGAANATDWIAATLTWLLAASFYAVSDLLIPFVFFPWMAAASLLLIPWLFLSAFSAPNPVMIAGFAIWGTLAAFGSELVGVRRLQSSPPIQNQEILESAPQISKYHFPLLALSLPLFLMACSWGVDEDTSIGFAAFLGAGLVYTVIHAMRPRGYVWLTALLAGLGAYFTFYALPFMGISDVYLGYRLLGASLLLTSPELFFKEPLSFGRSWNWPPVALGALLTAFSLLAAFLVPVVDESQFGNTALILGVYSLLFFAYAWRFKQPAIGYLASASAALALAYMLQHFERDECLPALTALTVVYFAAGYFLARREQVNAWGMMLVHSGLALGALVSVIAVFTVEPTGGWYALIVAALFIVEMYTRRTGYLEFFVNSILSIALILLLNDFNVRELPYYLFGLSLLWLACDVVFRLSFQIRKLEPVTKILGALFTFAAAVVIYNDLDSLPAALCFGAYAIFLAAYAWLQKNPLFGYASTSALALTLGFGLLAADIDLWLIPMIGLAALFYAAGFFLRWTGSAKGWNSMLLFSGLGLGTLVALAAPFEQGGLEKAIPIAIAATFFAAEAFARKNVWLGFPANALYLMSYVVILNELKVDEPQFYSVGAAALGLLMHYLLRRAGNKTTAFLMGLISQLTLLGTTYVQMVDTGELKYFFVLFFQVLVVLGYGIVVRSRSLVIAPIVFVVLAIATVLYNALRDLSLVFIIGVAGIILLALGILAVVMRERITTWAERFGDWEG